MSGMWADFTRHPTNGHTVIALTIPFADLVSDNGKYGVFKGKMILSKKYREAKDTISLRAYDIPASQRPLEGRLRLEAIVYEPDKSRSRDISNWCKLTHDAFNGILFYDDSQLDEVRWIRGPIDNARPRVEFTITPIE